MKNEKEENQEDKENNDQAGENKKSDKKAAENHRQAAKHNMEAAKHHLAAAEHYEAGNYKKAAYSTVLAHGHHAIAGEFLNDDAKHHAQALKQTFHND